MIIVNTTYSLDSSIETEWVEWIKNTFIPIHQESGLCNCLLLQVENKYDQDGISYALQISFNNNSLYNTFKDKYDSKLQKLIAVKFKGKFVAFSTLLKKV